METSDPAPTILPAAPMFPELIFSPGCTQADVSLMLDEILYS